MSRFIIVYSSYQVDPETLLIMFVVWNKSHRWDSILLKKFPGERLSVNYSSRDDSPLWGKDKDAVVVSCGFRGANVYPEI